MILLMSLFLHTPILEMFGMVTTSLHRDDLFTLCKSYYCKTSVCFSNAYRNV